MNKILIKLLVVFLPFTILYSTNTFGNWDMSEYNFSYEDIQTLHTTSSPTTDSNRAMYINDFDEIFGNVVLEDNLLSFVQSRNIKTLLLYDLHTIHTMYNLTDPVTNTILADFISKAKTTFGVYKIGATSENDNSFINVIDVYNNSRTAANEKFDIYNLEFEFWIDTPVNPGGYYCNNYLIPNGLPCNNAGAFEYFMSVLETMNDLAENNIHPITTEAYIGWPTATQAETIAGNLDLLRMHAYVSIPDSTFSYADERLYDFASSHPNMDVSIIFSAEDIFMQPWLQNNSIQAAEDIFTTYWLAGSADWDDNITLDGFTYYNYSHMANVPLHDCPSHIILKDLTLDIDTIINASTTIELNNVTVNPPYQLTLIVPDVIISIDSAIPKGASIIIVGEDGCDNE